MNIRPKLFNLTENLYSGDFLYGSLLAIVIVSPSYTLITIPLDIGGTKGMVSFQPGMVAVE